MKSLFCIVYQVGDPRRAELRLKTKYKHQDDEIISPRGIQTGTKLKKSLALPGSNHTKVIQITLSEFSLIFRVECDPSTSVKVQFR